MSRTLLEFTQEMKDLALMMEQIDGVEQVRIWPTLRREITDLAGEDSLSYSVMVRNKSKPDDYIQMTIFVPARQYNDRNQHLVVVNSIKTRVQQYYR